MKKTIAIALALSVAVCAALSACSGNKENTTASPSGLGDSDNVYSLDEAITVTDEDGNAVTDENGEVLTTIVNVQYDGDGIGHVIDKDGNPVTDSSGNEVTLTTQPSTDDSNDDDGKVPTTAKHTTTETTTVKPSGNENTTSSEHTTIKPENNKVPSTSATGEAVTISSADQQAIKSMLEVPYLYKASYENADGVPLILAKHAALWMAEREHLNTSNYASQSIVLDLFAYFGQTVINFKTNCNTESTCPNIKYISNSDSFKISDFENSTHTVSIKKVEYLGNNNYYKVTASVSGVKNVKTVVAVMQKNRLDSSLGFSVKALKWS